MPKSKTRQRPDRPQSYHERNAEGERRTENGERKTKRMNPILLDQSLVIAQLLLKYGPDVANNVAAIFGKESVTAADWEAVFARARTPFEKGLKADAFPAVTEPQLTPPA